MQDVMRTRGSDLKCTRDVRLSTDLPEIRVAATAQIGRGSYRTTPVQMIAAPGQQATGVQGGLWALVAAHGATRTCSAGGAGVAFLDPPADSAFAGVVGAIRALVLRAMPGAVTREARPQIPTVQEQQAETVG